MEVFNINWFSQTLTVTEPNNWHCTFCKEEFTGPWQLMKHARTAHDTQIYLDEGSSEQAPGTGQ